MSAERALPKAAQRASVLRLWDADVPIGTAFGIGPRIALTCYHCVRNRDRARLHLRTALPGEDASVLPVAEVLEHPRAVNFDAALLRVEQDLPHWLPASALSQDISGPFLAYGFPGTRLHQPAVRIDVQSRGTQATSYSDAYDEYSLDDALILAGDPAAPGMSGGPVVDEAAGAVIAIIVAGPEFNGRTVALPLFLLAAGPDWAALRHALIWNRNNTRQWSWSMNLSAAQQLCSDQVRRALARLAKWGRYDASRYVPRQQMLDALGAFVRSPAVALLISGGANLGKTSSMAASADDQARHSVFLDGFRIADLRRSMVQYVCEALSVEDAAPNPDITDQISKLLREDGQYLTVFIDAINEAGDNARHLQGWLLEAIEDARERGMKLIVSSRSDTSNALALQGEHLRFFELREFTQDEAEMAAPRYGLTSALISSGTVRHPLMFAIAARLTDQPGALVGGRYAALLAFVKELICRTPGVSAEQVTGLFAACSRIAASAGADGQSIEWDLAANLLGGSSLLDRFVNSGLFRARDHEVIRFVYDEMLEALRPPLDLDQPQLTAEWERALKSHAIANRMVSSLLRCQYDRDLARVASHVESLRQVVEAKSALGDHGLISGKVIRNLGWIIAAITSGMPSDAEGVGNQVAQMFRSAITTACEASKFIPSLAFAPEVELAFVELDLPVSLHAEILTDLLAYLEDTDLRTKDLFDRGGSSKLLRETKNPHTIVAALLAYAQRYPAVLRDILLPKLDDQRQLFRNHERTHGEVTVGELVAAILRLSCTREFDALFQALLDRRDRPAANQLMRQLAEDHPALAIDSVMKLWDAPAVLAILSDVIASTLRSVGPGRAPPPLVLKLTELMRNGTQATSLQAAELLRLNDPDNVAAWDEVKFSVVSAIATRSLLPVPRSRLNEFVDALARRSDDYALQQMGQCDERLVQEPMAAIALRILASSPSAHANALARLVEEKGWKWVKSEEFAVWREFIFAAASNPLTAAEESLCYFAFPTGSHPEWHFEFWSTLLGPNCPTDTVRRCIGLTLRDCEGTPLEILLKYLAVPTATHLPIMLDVLINDAARDIFVTDRKSSRTPLYSALTRYIADRCPNAPDWIRKWNGVDDPVALFAGRRPTKPR